MKNGNVEIEHIREMVAEVEKEKFIFKNWFPRPGLKEKNTDFVSRLYIGQSYDKNQFDLVEDGWINDHCEICIKTLGEEENEYVESSGYFDGVDWICKSCFEELVLAENLESKLNALGKVKE
ncbi:hypothetical protein [Flavobacterium sp.]|uniref:hypothetical protein n=1 Tax=Flavobacterium sp. TaxID=239 RepID=UPI00391DC35F